MQQADEDALRMMRRSLTARSWRERCRCSGISEYAMSVDKSDLPVGESKTNHAPQAAKNLRKNLLRPLPDSV